VIRGILVLSDAIVLVYNSPHDGLRSKIVFLAVDTLGIKRSENTKYKSQRGLA